MKMQLLTVLLTVAFFGNAHGSGTNGQFQALLQENEKWTGSIEQPINKKLDIKRRYLPNLNQLSQRVSALETKISGLESQGINSCDEDTNAVATSYNDDRSEIVAKFNSIVLNEGDGYNSTTGTFTVPTGGDGYYYFSVYFTLKGCHNGVFQLNINEQNICTAIVYTLQTDDFGQSSCGGVIYAEEGDKVQVVLERRTEPDAYLINDSLHLNGFTGYRI